MRPIPSIHLPQPRITTQKTIWEDYAKKCPYCHRHYRPIIGQPLVCTCRSYVLSENAQPLNFIPRRNIILMRHIIAGRVRHQVLRRRAVANVRWAAKFILSNQPWQWIDNPAMMPPLYKKENILICPLPNWKLLDEI